MPVPDFGGLPPYANFEDVTNKVNDLVQRLRQLLLNLDTLNIKSLNAEVIVAGTITGDKIQANTITGDKVQANTITADKLLVNELSAISANLGHIVAGLIESVEIYGSYISTNKTGYPKAEMSNTNDLFATYLDANNYLLIQADYSGAPSLVLVQGGVVKYRLSALLGTPLIDATGGMEINVIGGKLNLPKFTDILSSDGYNLGVELDEKAVAGISTEPSGAHNHGIPDGTQFKDVNGVTWTYRVAGTHTHEQTS
ncbi:hypothetical protein [Paenibacillus sp. FSL R5-0486]|uniref:hypothetical protein n=1 Tax=Paenibacillus sp. FSL R5-0486 TaxID=2921645 RepID=UPI0030D82FAC